MTNPFEILEDRLIRIENLLIDLRKEIQTQQHTEISDELLTVKQVANLLSLSVPTIYGYVSRHEIPFSKRGKRLYFSKQDLMNWIKQSQRNYLNTKIR